MPIEDLQGGKLAIYELMAEESAVNYWEKYGNVRPLALSFSLLCLLPCIDISLARLADRLRRRPESGAHVVRPDQPIDPVAQAEKGRWGRELRQWRRRSRRGQAQSSGRRDGQCVFLFRALGPFFRRACPLRSSPLRGMSPAPFPFRTDPHLAPRTLAQTIRRDSYGIPSMIVGNFIKL